MSAVESKKNLETRAMRYLVRREYSRQELAQKLSTNAKKARNKMNKKDEGNLENKMKEKEM